MPMFDYKVKDKEGKLLKGQISMASKEKLLQKFKKQELTPIEIKEIEGKPGSPEEKKKGKEKGKKKKEFSISLKFGVSEDELAFFTRQFATILNAGLPLSRIISILHNQTDNPKLREAVHDIGKDLQKGSSITESLRGHKDVFGDMYISMIAVGETSGNLPDTINRLADTIEKNMAVKKKIKSAMAYPIFIFIFSVILSYVLIAVFLPGFIPMFNGVGLNLQQDYPLTYFLIKLSNIATDPKWILAGIAVIVLAFFGFNLLLRNEKGRRLLDKVAFQIPGFNELFRQAAVARFCRSFSNLSKSGIPVMQALSLVAGASGNTVVSDSVERIASQIKEGGSLSETMKKEVIFPDLVIQMVNVGEEAGSVPEMFERTADYLEQGLDNKVTALTSMMEPAMMVFVGMVVGVFVMGILLPILGITQKLGG